MVKVAGGVELPYVLGRTWPENVGKVDGRWSVSRGYKRVFDKSAA